jgi:hypothetical protein
MLGLAGQQIAQEVSVRVFWQEKLIGSCSLVRESGQASHSQANQEGLVTDCKGTRKDDTQVVIWISLRPFVRQSVLFGLLAY